MTSSQNTRALTHPWTVLITLRVWKDDPDAEPILEAVENALRPVIGKDEAMHVELLDASQPRGAV